MSKASNRSLHRSISQIYGKPITKTHPSKIKFWDYQRNTQPPATFTFGSNVKVNWICSKDQNHFWFQSISGFLAREVDCMYCGMKRLPQAVILEQRDKIIAAEWHPTLNYHFTPKTLSALSKRKAWWICSTNTTHVYCAAIYDRVKKNVGCPFCLSKLVSQNELFTARKPGLVKCWNSEKNYGLLPSQVSANSDIVVFFNCMLKFDREKPHIIPSKISEVAKNGLDCRYCELVYQEYPDITKTHPKLVKQWHPEKNKGIQPTDVTSGSQFLIWWQCPKAFDHIWRSSVSNRTANKSPCPFCKATRQSSTSSFAVDRPDLLEQWHNSKNKGLDPHSLPSSYRFKVW